MDNLHSSGRNDYVPEIDFNTETGEITISGESYHEYTLEFFEPLFDQLRKYTSIEGKSVTMNFKMTYYNTGTAKKFLEIINLLETYQQYKKGQVIVNWYYFSDDKDMLESGREYADESTLIFNFIPY